MPINKYLAEFVGTFFLVLTIGCTVLAGSPGVIAPLAIGSALMVMIYGAGHLSGAHFNPAVTIAVWLRGRCPSSDVVPYIASQVLGASAAAATVRFLRPAAAAAVQAMNPEGAHG
jgi:aquaporin Z